MILPIVTYGQGVLRQKCKEIDQNYPNLEKLIEDMWDSLYPADGTGLAAPQVNHAIRMFIVDSKEMFIRMKKEDQDELFDGDEGIQETFINPRITNFSKETWIEQEGCLSIPGLSEDVKRSWTIKIEYFDRNFQKHEKTFSGTTARVIQHEYDHLDGKLYVDYLSPIKKKLLKGKLNKISRKLIKTKYPVI